MKTIEAGPRGCFGVGFIRDVSEEDGALLINGGYAVLVEKEKTEIIEEPEEKEVPTKENKKGKVKKHG